jgi:hypothetical protein
MTVGTAGVVTAGVLGLSLLFPRRTPVARWRRLRAWEGLPDGWENRSPKLYLDERRNCLFHLGVRLRDRWELLLWRLDLGTLASERRVIPWLTADVVAPDSFTPEFHAGQGLFWLVERGMGPIWHLHPDTGEVVKQPGGVVEEGQTRRSFLGALYWNPVNGRLGTFGGYGYYAVRNWRWEYDARTGMWENVEPNRPGQEPRPRSNVRAHPMGDARHILFFGGMGSLSGRQDDVEPGLPHFDGRFHRLGDLWRLDLATGAWQCLVPAPGLTFSHIDRWSACYLRERGAFLVSQAREPTDHYGTRGRLYLHRVGQMNHFIPVTLRGDLRDGATHGCLTVLPDGHRALGFHREGIFELSLEG